MKNRITFLLLLFLISCSSQDKKIIQLGETYQQQHDYVSLAKVVDLLSIGTDSLEIRKILGPPIDMGFDFRYLIDSTGSNGCTIGAVFHFDNKGKVDQKWIDEICE
jgi:hypothetical protein